MSPRTGRPTNDPKIHERKIRFSDKEIEKIDYCCEVFGLTKADVIRQGIEEMFQKARGIKEQK